MESINFSELLEGMLSFMLLPVYSYKTADLNNEKLSIQYQQ
jgi:hypothetical protein